MNVPWNWILVVAGALLVLVEVSLGGFAGFDLVLIGSSFAIGGAVGLLLGSTTAGTAVAAVLCLLYIAVGRRWMRRRVQLGPVPSNTDAVIGQRALVLVPLTRHAPGQVKVHGEVWRAVPAPGDAEPIEPGAEVMVEGVDGVTLRVRRAAS
jgi:membrane protein implicated in regulation of membrane protease activity